jgi:hypothetical protein
VTMAPWPSCSAPHFAAAMTPTCALIAVSVGKMTLTSRVQLLEMWNSVFMFTDAERTACANRKWNGQDTGANGPVKTAVVWVILPSVRNLGPSP